MIYFKGRFANEKRKYFCLNQRQISVIFYFRPTAVLNIGGGLVPMVRSVTGTSSRTLQDYGSDSPTRRWEPHCLVSHAFAASSALGACGQRYSTLFHKT